MSLQTCAAAAVATFPASKSVVTARGVYPLPVVMLGIGGAEDGWGNGPGDPLSIYRDGGVSERPYSCGGYTSFGWPQINLPAHYAMVAGLSGIPASNPCGQAAWLADYTNAARAAYAVYRSQGLGAWTTYNTGAYLQYLGQAQAAVEAIAGLSKTVPGPVPSLPQSGASPAYIGGFVAIGGIALLGVSLLAQRHARR